MWTYVARRLMWLPFLLLAVSIIIFALGRFAPGDPVQVMMGQYQNPVVQQRLQTQYGLDRPVHVQYGIYVWGIIAPKLCHVHSIARVTLPKAVPLPCIRGDFGESYKFRGRSVAELIGKRTWVSIQMGVAAMIISIGLGVPIGFFAALKQGSWLDVATVSTTLFFMSLPVFITAPFLLIFFVLWADNPPIPWPHWLPYPIPSLPSYGWQGFLSPTIVMPALVMGVPGVAIITRLTRASTLEVLNQDFVRTARAKGLKEMVVQRRHILRNALIPIFTVVGLSLGGLVETSFIVERYFGIPGVGNLAIESFFARDYPVITALGLIIAVAFVIANLVVDIGYRFIDPRIRY